MAYAQEMAAYSEIHLGFSFVKFVVQFKKLLVATKSLLFMLRTASIFQSLHKKSIFLSSSAFLVFQGKVCCLKKIKGFD